MAFSIASSVMVPSDESTKVRTPSEAASYLCINISAYIGNGRVGDRGNEGSRDDREGEVVGIGNRGEGLDVGG